MKTIRNIFRSDIKNLVKNFFALVIAIGVCFLPALYAWFNIYSNWDPYGNTGSLKLAAVCLDEGYTDENGEFKNVGAEIVEDMADSDKVDWQFVDSEKEALKGVESGYYYAAVIIQENFTYNMYNMFIEDVESPTLVFYQNQKKNPVATKISDTVVSTLERNINEEFVKVMTSTIFADANDVYDDIEEDGGVDEFINKLETLNNEIIEYENTMDRVIAGNAVLSSNLTKATADAKVIQDQTEQSSGTLKNAAGELTNTEDTLDTYKGQVDLTIDTMLTLLTNMQETLEEAKLSGDVNAMVAASQQTYKDTDQLMTDIEALSSSLSPTADQQTIVALGELQTTVEQLQNSLKSNTLDSTYDNVYGDVTKSEKDLIKQIQSAINNINSARNIIDNKLIPQLDTCIENLQDVILSASGVMHNMSGVLASMGDVFGSLQTTVSASDTSFSKTRDALEMISGRISKAIDKANSVNDDERVKALVDTLAGDPELYGEFFSEPVEIESVAIYPIENYGSAVAPFYTTLSIWVGVIILAAIIKVKANKKKYADATPEELFFGRGMFFLFMGQLQTVITVLGNLLILKIQCVHPFLFWLTSAITSLVFTWLIYALVFTFGDVGKAVAVVVLVLQIAGSSGTYPIELLPEFFQKVYIFFPFPYAINAMRECICGLYQADIVIYLLQLLAFLIPAFVIGLVLRLPFEEFNRYMEERMEDTEMM